MLSQGRAALRQVLVALRFLLDDAAKQATGAAYQTGAADCVGGGDTYQHYWADMDHYKAMRLLPDIKGRATTIGGDEGGVAAEEEEAAVAERNERIQIWLSFLPTWEAGLENMVLSYHRLLAAAAKAHPDFLDGKSSRNQKPLGCALVEDHRVKILRTFAVFVQTLRAERAKWQSVDAPVEFVARLEEFVGEECPGIYRLLDFPPNSKKRWMEEQAAEDKREVQRLAARREKHLAETAASVPLARLVESDPQQMRMLSAVVDGLLDQEDGLDVVQGAGSSRGDQKLDLVIQMKRLERFLAASRGP